jgi:hypothetical protein
VAAEALGAGPHAVETVSGDLRLATESGVTLRANTFSGEVRAESAHRTETKGGQRIIVVGDGRAVLEFRSMSGDAHLAGPDGARGEDAVPETAPTDATVTSTEAPTGGMEDELDVLRALERGEIDVDEAARRLEGTAHHA